MARLADYLAKLAVLFGNKEHVYFMKVRNGSAIQEIVVDAPASGKVATRLNLASSSDPPEDIIRANRDINRMLREDNATGGLKLKGGAKVLEFPGRKTPLAEEALVYEVGELDDVVIKIGGKDDTAQALLEGENGVYYAATRPWTWRECWPAIFSATPSASPAEVNGAARKKAPGNWILST